MTASTTPHTEVPSIDPRAGTIVETVAHDSTPDEVAATVARVAATATALAVLDRADRARLLHPVADELAAAEVELVALAERETALGSARLTGELARACFQLRYLADAVADGGYLELTFSPAADTPLGPRPDLRRTLVPIGPVAAFGAGNFPFAFSVAGGDTAAALAAGCPVVVKAHPGHPATSLRTLAAVQTAIARFPGLKNAVDMVFGLRRRAGAGRPPRDPGRRIHRLAHRRTRPLRPHLRPIAEAHRDRRGGALVVLLTDLPRRAGTHPIASDFSASEIAALVSVPALRAI